MPSVQIPYHSLIKTFRNRLGMGFACDRKFVAQSSETAVKFTIRKKLIFGISFIVIFQLVTGILFYRLHKSAMDRSTTVFNNVLQKRETIEDLCLAIDRVVAPASDWIITLNPIYKDEFPLLCKDVEEIIDTLAAVELTETELNTITAVKERYDWIKEFTKEIFNFTNPQGDAGAARLMNSIYYELRDPIIKELKDLRELQEEKVKNAQMKVNLTYRRFNIIFFAWIASIIISGAFIISSSLKYFIKPIYKIQEGAENIAKGNLGYRVDIHTRDELEQLADAFNNMSERLQNSFSDLEEEKDKLQTILLNIVDGVVVSDAKYNLLFMNPVAETVFGKQYSDLEGKDFLGCHKEDDRVMKILQSNQLPITSKVSFNSRILHINATSIKKSDGTKIGYLMIVRDITDQEKARERLEELAITDGLTKLYNHNYFQHCLEYEFSKAQRYNLALSLIMLDIDYFKSFNDQYGHQMGDIVLATLGQLLKGAVRKIDIVARYGGEEFAIILPHTGEKESQILAERLREKTEKHIIKSMAGHPLNVTISIGVATFAHNNFRSKDDLIKGADDALYKAKKSGRNRVNVF